MHKTASEKDQRLLSTVVQLRHWLSEAERDASISVDIINLQAIRDAAHAIQVPFARLFDSFSDISRLF